MKRLTSKPHILANRQGGFIPMLIMLVLMLVVVMGFAYRQVMLAQH